MLTNSPFLATTSPTCLLPFAPFSGARLRMSNAGRFGASGTPLSTYAHGVPAFIKGSAVPGVRAWSPPV